MDWKTAWNSLWKLPSSRREWYVFVFSAVCASVVLLFVASSLDVKLPEWSWGPKLLIGHPYRAAQVFCVLLGILAGRTASSLWFRTPAKPGAEVPDPLPPPEVSLSKLPITRPQLFGRDEETGILNKAWENPLTNVVSIVAMGGQGKSALVNRWLKQDLASKGYGGARKVYGWTFYSQGTAEDKQASSDAFIDAARR